MKGSSYQSRAVTYLGIWLLVVVCCLAVNTLVPGLWKPESAQLTIPGMAAVFAGILALSELLNLGTAWVLTRRNKPLAEGMMVGRIYRLAAVLAIILSAAAGFGALTVFGTFFAMFGGMLLGWSLQAPVSGFAAWVLVSLKRPFRPGDRIQFPNLGLTGDVKDIGIMYTMLDQVGGTIGSEEAVGRFILVPNAMLFSQVVINYTV
ncbi:MAG TPA: mechanosensitive ion channel family protein, partial [Phycisphaerae bacterium]|nr:mechanosensitive ion channel family protein [Phycisphaerae bacterium]